MKKTATILITSFLLCGLGNPLFKTLFNKHSSTSIIDEITFVNIVRDLELLNSWLRKTHNLAKTRNRLYDQYQQKILDLYKVAPKSFRDSIKYYLEESSEKAIKVYGKVGIALEELSND